MIIDPEFKELIPPLDAETYRLLEESLVKNGCQQKITAWGEIIVDGHNRFEICTRLGIPYGVDKIHFESRLDAKLWMIQNQLARRNLNHFMRSELALKQRDLLTEFRQNSDERFRTDDKLGELANVSRDTIRRVEKIIQHAPEQIVNLARQGELSTNKAFGVVKALDGASPIISEIVATYAVTEFDTIERLKQLSPDSETLKDVLFSGYIDSGDRQVSITSSPVDVMYALASRSKFYRQIAQEADDYTRNPNAVSLILYDTQDLRRCVSELEKHFGDRLAELVDMLTARMVGRQ